LQVKTTGRWQKSKAENVQKKLNSRGRVNKWLLTRPFRRNGAGTKKAQSKNIGWAQVDASAQATST
jgi:hypothetical protein